MTRFNGGPADGKFLSLRNSVPLLRVTECNGEIDALDMWEDEPRPQEKLFLYRRTAHLGRAHVRRTKGSGWYAIAEYALAEVQPSDATMRDRSAWQQFQKENS